MKGRYSTNGDVDAAIAAMRSASSELQERLKEDSSPEQRVAIWQGLRRCGGVHAGMGFFVVAKSIHRVADDAIVAAMDHEPLKGIGLRLDAIKKRYGLADEEEWPLGEAPPECEALLAEWDRAADQVIADTFRRFGEHEMADLFLGDRAEFDRRYEEGRRVLFGQKE